MSKLVTFLSLLLVGIATGCASSDSPNDANNNNNNTTGNPKVHGRISLSASMNGSRTATVGDIEQTKTESALADLVFNLANVDVQTSSGARTAVWHSDSQRYGGSVSWLEIHSRRYECNGTMVTDIDSTTRTFSSASKGGQPGGVQLSIMPDGSYTIVIAAVYKDLPTHQSRKSWTHCPSTMLQAAEEDQPGIPFQQYFTPFIAGANGYFAGTIDPANPKRVNGSWHANDEFVLFSTNGNKITLPVEVTVTWDLTLE